MRRSCPLCVVLHLSLVIHDDDRRRWICQRLQLVVGGVCVILLEIGSTGSTDVRRTAVVVGRPRPRVSETEIKLLSACPSFLIPSVCLSICCLFACLFVCLCVGWSVCLSVWQSLCSSCPCPSLCFSPSLLVCLFVYLCLFALRFSVWSLVLLFLHGFCVSVLLRSIHGEYRYDTKGIRETSVNPEGSRAEDSTRLEAGGDKGVETS